MTRLRSLTISEKPTCSSREARRKTVGEVVTVWIRFLPTLCVGSRIIAGLRRLTESAQTAADPQPIPLRKRFKLEALSVSIDPQKPTRVTCLPFVRRWQARQNLSQLSRPDLKRSE